MPNNAIDTLRQINSRILDIKACNGYASSRSKSDQHKQEKNKSTEKRKPSAKPNKARFTFKEQREYDEIDAVIAGLEQEKAQVEQAIVQSNSDYVELQRLLERQSQIEEHLSEKTDRWLYLNDLADRIANESE